MFHWRKWLPQQTMTSNFPILFLKTYFSIILLRNNFPLAIFDNSITNYTRNDVCPWHTFTCIKNRKDTIFKLTISHKNVDIRVSNQHGSKATWYNNTASRREEMVNHLEILRTYFNVLKKDTLKNRSAFQLNKIYKSTMTI